jgi:hypothetical protein
VVSGDDSNETGRLAAMRIASATTAQEAAILLRSRGITHVALPLWDPALDQLVRIGTGTPAGDPLPERAFSAALQWWDMPLWMRPMDYLIPSETHFKEFEVRVFALQAEQEPDLGLSRLADFFVERGQLREAESVRESLKAYPRSVVALGATANVDFALREGVRLSETIEALVPYLSRRAGRDLPPDRRLSLAALFMRTKRVDLAREQLTECLEELDSDTLRKLTPGEVVNLVALSRSLGIAFPNKELETASLALIHPGVRDSLGPK